MKKTKRYYEFGDFLRDLFKFKVQKISINAGFTCPNRDGSKGWGGCTYCNNQTFSPEYCHTEKSVTEQLEEGVRFFSRKYPDMRYLAYFQAYTNTYDRLDSLILKYEEALAYPGVEGLIVGTRPDCMPEGLLDYFAELSLRKFVMIEYGLESTLDKTLVRINRGHTHEESESAIRRTAAKGIYTGAHLILGLPGESRDEILHHADVLSRLSITTLKLHQLQLIKNTRMAKGLIVGTRPDCMPEGLLDYFAELSLRKFVMIEYGLESTLDKTLVRINRGHTHEESESAIRRTAAKGIYTGAHLILGLPGESRDEILHHADVLSRLSITTLKLHQLQLIKNTRMAKEFKEDPSDFHLYTADEYIELVIDFIERLNPSIVVERFVSQSPKELLIAPDWGLKNFEFTAKVNKRIEERDTRQGRLFQV